ncbi:MAG: bifunctional DNA-formamidopyrimidine glycosylase/DNA-(apurinic or apyrimidinic site) lyase [bacterium]|nr:bifunctional DNA-formamidopyrimidine glycosylase/DNA-(apurinic or apyrimidinic site) lyase [bacterium]
MLRAVPELPEVETTRLALKRCIAGRRILAVLGKPMTMRRPLEPREIDREIRGRRVTALRRRGKYLLIDVEPHDSGSLLAHLGMSGRFAIHRRGDPVVSHTHLTILIEDDVEIRLIDPRRFGFVSWLKPGAEDSDPSLARLGLEPLDATLPRMLPVLYKPRRSPIKSLLLDQTLVAGIGNIYATEALWRAGIRPDRKGQRISLDRLGELARCVQAVLNEAIECGGTTLRDFSAPDGNLGYFAISLSAYGNQGTPCPRCGHTLVHMVLGGRTTAWCRQCQR